MTYWTEGRVAAHLVRHVFNRAVIAVPNCNWTGHEADLLVVECRGLRLIDVEIKLTHADLRADRDKVKWWRDWGKSKKLDWPPMVWKHYYCLPAATWRDDMLAGLPSMSGVLLVPEERRPGITVKRRCRANRDAKPISPAACIDIARLAGLRMWDTYEEIARCRQENERKVAA